MADQVRAKMLRAVRGGEASELFEVGATRILSRADAKRLEARGILKILGDAKAEPPVKNKAEGAAPRNKAKAPVTTSGAAPRTTARKR